MSKTEIHLDIKWQIFIRTKSTKKAQKILDSLTKKINYEFINQEMETYWKDENLKRARLTCFCRERSLADAFYNLMLIANNFGPRITSNLSMENDGWSMNADIQDTYISKGIEATFLEATAKIVPVNL